MIRYTFIFDNDTRFLFEIDEEDPPASRPSPEQIPPWMELSRFRCDICSIPRNSRQDCPAARALWPVVRAFDLHLSHEMVQLLVEREETTLQAHVSTQHAIRSMVGLLLPLSDCPVMRRLRPMTNFHLPLADRDHTAFRFMGMHLIAQYIRKIDGKKPDWDMLGLLDLLAKLREVNAKLAQRLRAATTEDATVNALIILDSMADSVELSLEVSLKRLRPMFEAYLETP